MQTFASLPCLMGHVTIHQVAAEAQVSVSSVSRILRGVANYSYGLETQQRVREAATRLGYQANTAARLLRSQEKTLIGLVTRLSVFPYANELLVAVRDELRARNYEPVILEPSQLQPSCDAAVFPGLDMLAGIISLYVPLGHAGELFREVAHQLPLVTLYPAPLPDMEWIYMDLAGCVELAARHLKELGHQRIAFAKPDGSDHPSNYLKAEGWERAVRKFDLDTTSDTTIVLPLESSVVEAATLTAQSLNAMKHQPTALICSSDELALCVLGQLAAQGWRLPHDLSVVGIDGIQFGAYSYPPLTTVVKPSQQIARAGVERLMQRIENPLSDAPLHQLIAPTLLVRGSTAPL